ncbi:rod shape-determining protein [Fulvivirga aurantia]|uniref:rod shape-determining protein n=1 Tax=Fulvivirga aurantia TaxID=2529383 RepID=UPI0016277EB6
MIRLFKKVQIHVKFYRNEIEVTRVDTNRCIKRSTNHLFSTDRLVIADFHNAEYHLTSLIKELMEGKSMVINKLIMIMQQMIEYPDGLSETEKRALRDLAEHAGAVEVYVLDHSKEINNQNLQDLINKN